VTRGYELNYPLVAQQVAAHPGPMGSSHSFAELAPGNLILTAMKKAEDDDGIIFRFYESAGKATNARLKLPAGVTAAMETNLMEKEEKPATVTNGTLVMPVRAWEIKAVKVRFGK
jgi:alpha-mannosidase